MKHRDAVRAGSCRICAGLDRLSGIGLRKRGVGAVERVVNLHTFIYFFSLLVLLKFLHISK